MTGVPYRGEELDLFRHATNWKGYYSACLRPFIAGDVLEVGAGIGGTSQFLCNPRVSTWTCLEPDPALLEQLQTSRRSSPLPIPSPVIAGTVADLESVEAFDTILYIDVLEHIQEDGAELARAAARLRSGGHLIVLSPAHEWLTSPFDRAIGHCRRYTASTLKAAGPPGLSVVRMFYIDSVGMTLSLANRVLLRNSYPTKTHIRIWDTVVIPMSRILDPLCLNHIGKSVIGIWQKGSPARSSR
jgi:2-polyprenyl-3-methyl-5-hydroxy-6-metoxy-1,4-benzoquinol methylase